MRVLEILGRHEFEQIVLHRPRGLAGRQTRAIGDPKYVGVHRDSGLAERRVQNDVRGLSADPRQLLEILARPDDKGPLLYFADEGALYNPRLKRRYLIEDDIPIMLIDEAQSVSDEEHARWLAKAEEDGITPTFAAGPEAS